MSDWLENNNILLHLEQETIYVLSVAVVARTNKNKTNSSKTMKFRANVSISGFHTKLDLA